MKAENKAFLDTNRHQLQHIKNGSIKNLNVQQMFRVMIQEFKPDHGTIDETNFEAVAKLVQETYARYDVMPQD